MVLIIIEECATEGHESNAVISFEQSSSYAITVRPPFANEAEVKECDFAWYFEEHLVHPFMEQVRAEQVAASITAYGEQLFKQVFLDNPDVYIAYKQCAEEGLSQLAFEIVGSPAFHALHWEALKDPELARPFVLDATMARKNPATAQLEASVRPLSASPTINILVVTARPNGIHDVGYHTISRPLVEALRQAEAPMQLDFVRPGTYAALQQQLATTTATDGPGYYHVIHFDVHGAILTYDELCERVLSNRPSPYSGEKTFLFLQHHEEVWADPLEASALAQLLQPHQIPIVLLNACQSGKVPEGQAEGSTRELSLGHYLIQAGVQSVVAMSYSVTVSAAVGFMSAFYRSLVVHDDVLTAIRVARTELATHKARRAYFNYQIELEDWLLPVVYQHQPVRLHIRPFTPEEAQRYSTQQATHHPEPLTTYGFVGRDLDVLEIERRLLTVHNILLVRGMGGAGKTTLLHHLAAWWQTTHLVEHVFYFGYDAHSWTLQEIIRMIAEQLVGTEVYQRTFQPLPLHGQQDKLTTLLRERRHLLILDNLESITGTAFAMLSTLPAQEQEALHRFLIELAGGQTFALLGSRSEETWLSPGTFADNRYTLGGLDNEAASALTNLILERYSVTHYRTDVDLQTLLKLLDGFPLALQIVLANFANQTPAEVLTALQSGNVGLDSQDGGDKTESILTCIDYSYRNLSPDAQNLLLCLAPFTSVFDVDLLGPYMDLLIQSPLLATLPFEQWDEVLREAQHWGLLIPDVTFPTYFHLHPIFPYFLRTRLQAPEMQERRAAIDIAFRHLYDRVGYTYYTYMQAKEPRVRSVGLSCVQLEYENLTTALCLALAAHASIIHPYLALDEYLERAQEPQRGLALAQMVQTTLATYPPTALADSEGEKLAIVLDRIGIYQYLLKQYAAAKRTYEQVLALCEQQVTAAPERKKQLAPIYHQLGMIAQAQRLWPQAEQYYRHALQIKEEFGDRYEQAPIYHQLGRVAQEQRLWPQAAQYYQQALDICEEFRDRHTQATTYHQLGMVAEAQQQWQLAEQYYQQALHIYEEFGDHYEPAGTYHNLGNVMYKQQQWQQAKQYYQRALLICEEFGNHYEQADTYHQLAMVEQKQRQWQQAEQYYQQALHIYEDFEVRYEQAGTYGQLGLLAAEQEQWQQARAYLLQALTIFAEYKDEYSISMVFDKLARLWRASGDKELPAMFALISGMTADEVEQNFRKVLERDASK